MSVLIHGPVSVLDATFELLLGLNEAVSVDVLESWMPLEKEGDALQPLPLLRT